MKFPFHPGRVRLVAASLWLCASVGLAADPDPPGADLASVHAWLRTHSAALQARELDAQAAQARTAAAGALPEPMFEIELDGIDRERPRLLPAQVGETAWRVRQRLPLWGKRGLEREIAAHEAGAAAQRRDGAWLELVEQADMAWLAWWHAQARSRLQDELIELMARMRELARLRYAAGLAPQQDALRAEVELTGMQRMRIEIDTRAARARATLNARLGRMPQDPLAAPAQEPEIAIAPALDELLAGLASGHPMAQAEASMHAARAGMAESMRRERWPDVELGLGLMQMGDRLEGFELMLQVEIPLQWGARRARENAAALRADAAAARAQAVVDELRGRAGAAYAMWQAAGEQERLIVDQLLPQAQAGFESALAGYQVGAIDFDTLLEAARALLDARGDRLDARRERLEAALELTLLHGDTP